MLVRLGEEKDKNGKTKHFAQYGKIGKKYYYNYEDKETEDKAIAKAKTQSSSIEKFIRNYWNMKNDF